MRFEYTQITQFLERFFKSLCREKLTEDENVRFIKGNKLKLAQVELLSFLIFKSVHLLSIKILVKLPHFAKFRPHAFNVCQTEGNE